MSDLPPRKRQKSSGDDSPIVPHENGTSGAEHFSDSRGAIQNIVSALLTVPRHVRRKVAFMVHLNRLEDWSKHPRVIENILNPSYVYGPPVNFLRVLPNEIVHEICSYLSRQDRLNFARGCHSAWDSVPTHRTSAVQISNASKFAHHIQKGLYPLIEHVVIAKMPEYPPMLWGALKKLKRLTQIKITGELVEHWPTVAEGVKDFRCMTAKRLRIKATYPLPLGLSNISLLDHLDIEPYQFKFVEKSRLIPLSEYLPHLHKFRTMEHLYLHEISEERLKMYGANLYTDLPKWQLTRKWFEILSQFPLLRAVSMRLKPSLLMPAAAIIPLTKVTYLSLQTVPNVADMHVISQTFPNLRSLKVKEFLVDDVKHISMLTRLNALSVEAFVPPIDSNTKQSNQIACALSQITQLHIFKGNLPYLPSISQLRVLNMVQAFFDIDELRPLTRLTTLRLSYQMISEIHTLTSLCNLTELTLYRTPPKEQSNGKDQAHIYNEAINIFLSLTSLRTLRICRFSKTIVRKLRVLGSAFAVEVIETSQPSIRIRNAVYS